MGPKAGGSLNLSSCGARGKSTDKSIFLPFFPIQPSGCRRENEFQGIILHERREIVGSLEQPEADNRMPPYKRRKHVLNT